MANTNNTRKTFTNLSDPQQIRELNRQMEWLWHQLLGGLTDKAFSTGGIRRIVNKTEELVATDLNADSVTTDRLKAALAQIVVAQIAVADLDFAAVADLVAEAMVLEKGVADTVYVKNLLLTSANMLNAVIGKLVLKGDDGKYYDVSVGADGIVYTEEAELSPEEIAAGVTTGGKQILEDVVNAGIITGQSIYGNEAIFNTLLVGALNAGKITAGDALMASATIPTLYVSSLKALGDSLDISANDSITLIVGGVEEAQDTADEAKQLAQGAIAGTVIQYAANNSSINPPSSGWSTTPPAHSEGQYVWQKTVTTYVDGTVVTSTPVNISGSKGESAVLLRIDSSRGNLFKSNSVNTVLSVVIHYGSQIITTYNAMVAAFGAGSYLEWKYKTYNSDVWRTISSSDSRLSDHGFSFSLSPNDVDTKVTFMCELNV